MTDRRPLVDISGVTQELPSGDHINANEISVTPGLGITSTNAQAAFQELSSEATLHHSSVSNPHNVTKTQVGLGNVPNIDCTDRFIAAGKAGGQTAIGGTGSGESLRLRGSSHATEGQVYFGAGNGLYMDIVNGWVVAGGSFFGTTIFNMYNVSAAAPGIAMRVWTGDGQADFYTDGTSSVSGVFLKGNPGYVQSNNHVFYEERDNGDSGTADTINWQTGGCQKSRLTDNCTFTFTAPSAPCHLTLKITQDGTGSRTVTWPASVKWSGGSAPSLTTTANRTDIVRFYFDGTNYYGELPATMKNFT